jgi:hypothetical protein
VKRSPLCRRTPLVSRSQLRRAPFKPHPATDERRGPFTTLPGRSQGLAPRSAKKAVEDRERGKVIRALFPAGEFHQCAVPGCTSEATDPHEPLTRARGGSTTDPDNIVGLCRRHHDDIHLEPPWAYALGLLRHSWDPRGEIA